MRWLTLTDYFQYEKKWWFEWKSSYLSIGSYRGKMYVLCGRWFGDLPSNKGGEKVTYFLNFLLEIWVIVLLFFLSRKYVKEGISHSIKINKIIIGAIWWLTKVFFSSGCIFIFVSWSANNIVYTNFILYFQNEK